MKIRTLLRLLAVCGVASAAAADTGSVTASIDGGRYQIDRTTQGHEITLDGFGYLYEMGKPALPSRIFAIAIPPGATYEGLQFDLGTGVAVPGTYDIMPSPMHRVIGEEKADLAAQWQAQYDANHAAVYDAPGLYPAQNVEFVRTAGYRSYNLVDVRVTPFTYEASTGQLMYYPDISVEVQYSLPDDAGVYTTEHLTRTEAVAQDIILNYREAQGWYEKSANTGRGLHDYVIVTLDALTGAVQPLADWESSKGRSVEIVTTTWINSNYNGYDLAEKIRNFLRDKYPAQEWGIEDVLFVGHYDDVMIRRAEQDLGYGKPETDFYFAELSQPDSTSWDADGDHRYGENSDPIDFYAEVNVGRIPWSDVANVEHIVAKSIAFEQNNDPGFKKNILLLGSYFWADTDNAVLMETKTSHDYFDQWTKTRLYEQNSDYYSTYPCDMPLTHTNAINAWTSDTFAFVNLAGHGSPTSTHIAGMGAPAFVSTGDCNSLNDDYPAIIFADACSNQDTDYTNLGMSMIRRGAIGFVGATKVALGCPGWSQPYSGSSQSFDYFFTTYVTSGDHSQGAAHQEALREMYTYGLWGYNRYETFEWGAFLGNPNLSIADPPAISMQFPDGLPDLLPPMEPATVSVRIIDGTETYMPGSGKMYFRTDGGTYVESDLVDLGGGLFEVTLPGVHCDQLPEYYFTAEGDGGAVVTMPFGAPDAAGYSYDIGVVEVMMIDNFESDLGWTVENACADGQWERGTPVGGGDRGDPATDSDGSGQCYLTDNVDDNSDVDDGYTWLMSPTIDLSSGNADISFDLWYTNNAGAEPNNDLFKIYLSDDNGATWTLAETVGPNSSNGWIEHTLAVSDWVTPNATVKARFEASDLNGGSVVEAGIDDFKVTRFSCDEAGCPEDLNGDGMVDLADLGILLAAYDANDGGDIDGDGDTDLADLGALLAMYDQAC
jgi:hypothetical protein